MSVRAPRRSVRRPLGAVVRATARFAQLPLVGGLALAALTACSTDPVTAPVAAVDGTLDATQTAAAGKPSAPRHVSAVAGDASATVTWQPPTGSGSSPVSGYRIRILPGGRFVTTAAASDTTVVVTGLTNGTAYTFSAQAQNAAGYGSRSGESAAVTPAATAAPGRWVTGYYVGYQRALYPETSVDFTYMTHVVLGAAQATPTGGVTTDFYLDATNGPAMARALSGRAHAAGRKAIMMLGGAGYRDNLVSATSAAYRATFVANLLAALDNLGYDGLDVDWEPLYDGDKAQVLQFLRDLRAARPKLLLTFPVTWVNANFGADAWYAQVAPLVDQFNMMSYEMAGSWDGWVSWHSEALYGHGANHPSSIASSADAYRAAGVPAAKLGIGIGAYGVCWRGVTAPLQALSASTSVVASDNAMSYANILAQYYTASAYRWDATAHASYLTFAAPAGPQGCTFVSYEDPRSVADKGAYVAAQRLGGAIVWTVGQGHVATAAAGQQDPLLKAAYTAIVR